MKAALLRKALIVKPSKIHGYGVFAECDIETGEIIEECYAIVCKLHSPDLEDYHMTTHDKNLSALALGYGSIYNHTESPNAGYLFDVEESLVIFTARKPIKKGEEITIYYGDEWFSSRAMPVIEPSLRYKVKKFLQRHTVLIRFSIIFIILFFTIYFFAG